MTDLGLFKLVIFDYIILGLVDINLEQVEANVRSRPIRQKKNDAGPKSGRQFALDVFSGIIITCWF